MTGSTTGCLAYIVNVDKYMLTTVAGRTINRSPGRDGIHNSSSGAVMTGGAGAVAIGRYVMDSINGYHVVKTLMTGCTGSGNRHQMRIKMGFQADVREVAVVTGYSGAANAALNDTIISRVSMTAFTGDRVSVTGMGAAYMLVRHVVYMALATGDFRYFRIVVMVIGMGRINDIRMAVVTINRCLGSNKILDIAPGTLMTGVTGTGGAFTVIMLGIDSTQITI
jgi:hypothetical protein